MYILKNLLSSFIEIFYPKCCYGCENILLENKKYLCYKCRHNLPITNYHINSNNPLRKLFFGKINLELITSFLEYSKGGIVQSIIHNLKYKGHQDIGSFFGRWYGNLLSEENPNFKDIDIIFPVPLHKKKLRKRGYNQVENFGKELAIQLDAKYDNNSLLKLKNTKSQTTKSKDGRAKNTSNIFYTSEDKIENLKGKHIAIVDDVITTGATLENCCKELNNIPNIKISIITICKSV